MKTTTAYLVIIMVLFSLISCKQNEEKPKERKIRTVSIDETYQTIRDTLDNTDSPAFWKGSNGENWMLATAKTTDHILVFDASNGKLIKKFGESGNKPGQLERPNGIAIIDSLMLIVERDNKRVQIFSLPSFNFLGFIGAERLLKPYGLFVYKTENNYRLYVTDNYETDDEQVPPNSELNKRVHIYDFQVKDNNINSNFINHFGDTSGTGVLKIVESVYGDPLFNNILVSEEDESISDIKVYDLEGKFKGITFGKGHFQGQVEGIALYECTDSTGYWIITDQSYTDNKFNIFDRKTFEYLGTFKGNKTANTDGIWMTQKSFPRFELGAFFAVHDDGNVSTFRWDIIADSLELKKDCIK